MPFLAGLAPLLTAVAAAGSLAATGYELANQPSSATDAKQVQAQTAAEKAALQQQQKTAFLAAQPGIQSQTSGSLTPTAFNALTATTAGVPSDLNSLLRFLGTGAGTGTGSAPVSGGLTGTTGQTGQPTSTDLQTLSDLLKAA